MFLLTVAKADDDEDDESNTTEIVAWIVCLSIAGIILALCCGYCICVTFYAKPTINSKSSNEEKGFIQELSLSQYHRNVDESSTTQQNLNANKSMDLTGLPGSS